LGAFGHVGENILDTPSFCKSTLSKCTELLLTIFSKRYFHKLVFCHVVAKLTWSEEKELTTLGAAPQWAGGLFF
jgi:hypothetical protein